MAGYAAPGFDTLALHAGSAPDPVTGARAVPLHLSTSFVFESAEHAASLFNLERSGHVYSRLSNPTTAVLEERIAALDGGVGGLATASELLYGTQLWNAQRALQTGLVNQVHELGALDAAAEDLLQAISASSLDATRALKRGLHAVAAGDAQALAQAQQTFVQMFAGPDFTEGRDAFLQKRSALFPSHQP